MLRVVLFSLVTFCSLIAAPKSASAQTTYCYVSGVEGAFADGALIYEYIAIGRHEGLDSFRVDCRAGTIYARTVQGEQVIEFALVQASMPPDGRIPMFVQPDSFIKFRARYLNSTNRISVRESPDGGRAVIVEITENRRRIIAESRVTRGPGGQRLDERIGEPVNPVNNVETPAPQPVRMIETAAAAEWTDVPFERPLVLPPDLTAFYPPRAWERGVSGTVWVGVVVNAQGDPHETVVLAQNREERFGFGAAALQVAGMTRWPTVGPDGQAAPYRVRMSLNFHTQ